jgi:hypothetical protein
MVAEEKWVGLPDNSVKFVSRWFEAACPKCGPFFCLRKVGHHGMIAKKKLKDLFPERERKRLRSALPIGERDLLRQTLNGTREPKDGELERWIRLLNHLRQSS